MAINCNQATKMVEMKLAKNLSLTNRIQLWWHLAWCNACKQYEVQSQKIDTLLKTYMQRSVDNPLNDTQLKKRILESVPKEKN
jgi:hypothetical protein